MLPSIQKYKILLASKSPRRSQLLKEAGFDFQVVAKEVKESYPTHLSPEKVAQFLAQKKALASKDVLTDNQVILAADTIVTKDGIIYGKPKDYEEAVTILNTLSGNWHEVITGVCLLSLEKKIIFSSTSKVKIETLSQDEIEFYIANFKPYDKAGAYAIQEWIGLCKISKIEGTYSNIMGLPVDLVYKNLLLYF